MDADLTENEAFYIGILLIHLSVPRNVITCGEASLVKGYCLSSSPGIKVIF